MQGLSSDMSQSLQQLSSLRGGFGTELQTELEAYAKRGRDVSVPISGRADRQESQRDTAALDSSFSAFNDMAKHLSKSIKHGQADASQASASLLAVKDEVQAFVRDWARGVSEKSTRMVEDLLEHQQEHLTMVSEQIRRG